VILKYAKVILFSVRLQMS